MIANVSVTIDEHAHDTIGISDQSVTIFIWIVVLGLCQAVDIFGVVTNIINIMCFVKQGFSEPVNISLFGLAICDLGCLTTQMFINTLYVFIVGVSTFPFDVVDMAYLAAGVPHLAFSRVNSWITAIITLERCLCITVPLQVKNIVTPKRMWILILAVYATLLFSGAPVYAVNRLGMTFSAAKNRTILGIIGTADKHNVEGITFSINSFVLPFVAFIVIITCTIILVVNLRRKAKWRRAVTQTDISTREQKVAKMVVMISSLFIFCFVPNSVHGVAMAFEPRLNVGGKYVNISIVSGNLGFLLESINSSANIFIYYRMSTKYRDTFRSMFYRSCGRSNI